jgi:hypothetical protein
MLSCNEICKVLSQFEGEQKIKLEHFNPLFQQSPDFAKNYLQLVEDKIKENEWVDPNLEPDKFKELKTASKDLITEQEKQKELNKELNKEIQNQNQNISIENVLLNYKEHQTNDLPLDFLSLIDENRRTDLYYYGMKGPDSFLASILLCAEAGYWLQHRKKKKEYADQMQTTFSLQKYDILRKLPKESIGKDFLDVIYSNDFPERVDSDKSKEYQFLIAYHYSINVLILDFKELKGYFTTDWIPDKKTMIIINDNQTYLPILSNKISYFTADEIKNLESKFNILYPTKLILTSTITIDVNTENNTENTEETSNETSDDNSKKVKPKKEKVVSKIAKITDASQITNENIGSIKPEQIQSIAKYQLKDLQDIAEKFKIQLEYTKTKDNKTKIFNKTKKELYDDIIQFLEKV